MRRPNLILVVAMVALVLTCVSLAAAADGPSLTDLVNDLKNSNFGISSKAADALVELGDASIPAVCKVLEESSDMWARIKAANVLIRIGSPAAVPGLLLALHDKEENVRQVAAKGLTSVAQSSGDKVVPELSKALLDSDPAVRSTALDLLKRVGWSEEDISRYLAESLGAAELARQRLIIGQLGDIGPGAEVAVPALVSIFTNSEDPSLKMDSLDAISSIGGTEARKLYPALGQMLLDTDSRVRQSAISSLLRVGFTVDETAAPILAALKDADTDRQQIAIESLGQLAMIDKAAVSVLISLLEDTSYGLSVRESAYSMLRRMVRQIEDLDRGLVAVKVDSGVYVSWRLLGTDPGSISFNLYRDGVKVNAEPITSSTNYLDPDGGANSVYCVSAVVDGAEQAKSKTVKVWATNYLSIPLQKPRGGTSPDGVSYTYSANDASVGDLDGDGQYEIVLKWDPSNSKDNSQSGFTGNVFLDAYRLDGTRLWRIDLGQNIRAGAHYTQFMVYDLDGDGKAEVACKTADGTVDGTGVVIGDPKADCRNSAGYVLDGPEYLTIFDGQTGKALVTTSYDPPRGDVAAWGDGWGNRVDRFLACIAYLDGERPSLVMARGYYTRAVLVAYDWRDGKLTKRWIFDSNDKGNSGYAGQGNHNLSVGDVDGDGRDEIMYGACAIDHDGTGLYTTGWCHGDAMHFGDLDPDRPGLEVFSIHEPTPHPAGVEMHDAATGKLLWGIPVGDVGRGTSADLDPNYNGEECWASAFGGLFSAKGEVISDSRPSSINFAIWWDGDLLRELLDSNRIDKWDYERKTTVNVFTANGCSSNNGTKSTPSLQADILGDWREEVIWKTSDSSALRIYTTTALTEYRIPTLMHDPIYRLGIAWQNVAYNQPPHTSFFLGEGMVAPSSNLADILSALRRFESELGQGAASQD